MHISYLSYYVTLQQNEEPQGYRAFSPRRFELLLDIDCHPNARVRAALDSSNTYSLKTTCCCCFFFLFFSSSFSYSSSPPPPPPSSSSSPPQHRAREEGGNSFCSGQSARI